MERKPQSTHSVGETGFALGLGAFVNIERVQLSLSLYEDETDNTTKLDLGDPWPKQDLEDDVAWTGKDLAPIRDEGTIDLEPVCKGA